MNHEARKHIDAHVEANPISFTDTSKEKHAFIELRRGDFGLDHWTKEQCVSKFDKMKSEFKVGPHFVHQLLSSVLNPCLFFTLTCTHLTLVFE